MADVKIKQSFDALEGVTLDWLLTPLGLDQTQELATAIIVALGTDALAGQDDALPDPDAVDRRGWWGDLDAQEIWGGWPIGSKLWLLERAKITEPGARDGGTVNRVRDYEVETIQPFVNTRVISSMDVAVSRTGVSRIESLITLWRSGQPPVSLRYQAMWDELTNPAVARPKRLVPVLKPEPVVEPPVVVEPPPPQPPPGIAAWSIAASFAGEGTVRAIPRSRLLTTARLSGAGALAHLWNTQWTGSARFSGAGGFAASTILRKRASARFSGAGTMVALADLAFTVTDFNPDFNADFGP